MTKFIDRTRVFEEKPFKKTVFKKCLTFSLGINEDLVFSDPKTFIQLS